MRWWQNRSVGMGSELKKRKVRFTLRTRLLPVGGAVFFQHLVFVFLQKNSSSGAI